MSMSVSFKKATNKTNIKHNNREFTERQKIQNSHIDFSKIDENKILVQKDLRELYEQEFAEPLKKYNDKQKRNDRKIDNYYQHIQKSKKTSLQQEMIIQVGDKNDFNSPEDFEFANEILEEWFEDFEKRNPNLKVYNAIIHNDEASPHLHLNFVPVASGYKRGLEKQVSFDRAIKQQDKTLNKTRPFQDWREKEVNLLADKLKERGIERKIVGTNDYKDVNDYKIKKDLEKEIKNLEEDLSQKKDEIIQLTNERPLKLNSKDLNIRYETQDVEVPTGEKNIFGVEKTEIETRRTGNIVMPLETFKNLEKRVLKNGELENQVEKYLATDLVQKNQELERKTDDALEYRDELAEKYNELVDEFNELLAENSSLKQQIKTLKNEISDIYKGLKAFIKENTTDFSRFKGIFKTIAQGIVKNAPKGEFSRLERNDREINQVRRRSR